MSSVHFTKTWITQIENNSKYILKPHGHGLQMKPFNLRIKLKIQFDYNPLECISYENIGSGSD